MPSKRSSLMRGHSQQRIYMALKGSLRKRGTDWPEGSKGTVLSCCA